MPTASTTVIAAVLAPLQPQWWGAPRYAMQDASADLAKMVRLVRYEVVPSRRCPRQLQKEGGGAKQRRPRICFRRAGPSLHGHDRVWKS